ncbi:MAG: RHS repeat-associated core domain-containing protein, partial [Candidatus Izemoplasmatales bacterium]
RTYHATSALGVDVTFNIVFFVGGYDEAKTFNYSSEWLDQLESYAIMDFVSTVSHGYTEYDEQGNPLEQTNFVFRGTTYDHAEFSWDGRQLAGISVRNADDSVAATIAYQYNDQGYRVSKVVTVGTTVETYTYDLLGSTVHREVCVRKVSGVTQNTYEIRYLIDSDGSILGFVYEDATYYYLKDLQGNVIGVIDEAGNELVQYEYDAYGNVINNPDDPNGNIFEINPYTYRGYRYDSEIGMYYLNSRYYSPALSRFLNADGLLGELGDIASVNMYTYCANNPVMYTDSDGDFPIWLLILTVVYATWATQDVIDIANGDVYFEESESGDGGRIVNSYKVQNPSVVLGYSIYLRYFSGHGDCFNGTATGIASEWMVHNAGYDITYIPSRFGFLESENDRAAHADIGRTVFNEKEWYVSFPSVIIETSMSPVLVIIDYFQYINQDRGNDHA